MVNVKLFGLLRLDSGIKELTLEASSVRELFQHILDEVKKSNPATTVTRKDVDGCYVQVNGKDAGKSTKLADGDTVLLFPPVCGG